MEASEKSSFLLQYLATDMRLVSPPVRGEIVTRLERLPPAVEHYGAIDWRVTWKSGRRVPQTRSCLQATLDRLWLLSGRLTVAEVVLQALVVQGKDGVDDVGHNALRRLSGGSLDDHLISCSPFRRILTVATSRTNYFGWLASGFRWSWTSSVHRMMTFRIRASWTRQRKCSDGHWKERRRHSALITHRHSARSTTWAYSTRVRASWRRQRRCSGGHWKDRRKR